ncbi:DMT family transporter [Flavobacterium sp. NKUCC04_CG]|uniref:DMT family transporter n=1 Tax=Flavobacterium sp. NKUCC04_CG TaxID=2842121 RepID=UPI001C5B1042|nr:DMT family transporter [Flavobacterium sp. NKUCC04_CG]MBW3518972.1 DMT family transporter [Flavobacterium sp. NKUCC04_CG]
MNQPRLALLIGIVCISIFPVLVRLNLVPSLSSAFYRMAIASVVLVPYAVFTKQFKTYSPKLMGLMVLSGIIFGSDVAVWNIAIVGSSATQATLLTNLAPVWVGIGSYFILKIKPTTNFWWGTALALIGMVVLVGVDVFVELRFDQAFVFGVLSGVFYATYMLLSKRILEEVPVVTFMTFSLLASAVYLGIWCVIAEEPLTGFSNLGWGVLLIQGVVCQLLAWLLISFATKHMRATRVSLSLLSQALLASLLAWIFLHEEINAQMIVGGVIVLIGIGITFFDTSGSSFEKFKKYRKQRNLKL